MVLALLELYDNDGLLVSFNVGQQTQHLKARRRQSHSQLVANTSVEPWRPRTTQRPLHLHRQRTNHEVIG